MLITLEVRSIDHKEVTAIDYSFESTKIFDLRADPTTLPGASYFVYWNEEGDIKRMYTVTQTVAAILALIGGGTHYRGVFAAPANYPAGSSSDYWRVSAAGQIGGAGGPYAEIGDMLICNLDSVGGTFAAVGASYQVIEKDITETTVASLRTGTATSEYIPPYTLTLQGVDFDAAFNLGLLRNSAVAGNIGLYNLSLAKGITGTLDGANCTLTEPMIVAYNNITVDNTANETATYGGNVGLSYWQGELNFTHNGAGACAVTYLPIAAHYVLDSTPINAGGGTLTCDSWIWGVLVDAGISGAASLSTIHNDSWGFKSDFGTVQTANIGAGDWTGFYSKIDGINDPLVIGRGFYSVIQDVLDATVIYGYHSDINVDVTSIADQHSFSALLTGSLGTGNINSGLWLNLGDASTPETYTVNNAAAIVYGTYLSALTGGLVQTNGTVYGHYMYMGSTFTPSATNLRTAIYAGGLYTTGIDFKNCSLVDEAYAGAGTGRRNHAAIDFGTWDNPMTFTPSLDHIVPIQANIRSNASAAVNVAAARLRVDTSAANTLTNVYALQTRNTIAHDVASLYGISSSMNLGTFAVITGALAAGAFSLEGTGAVTPAGANPIDVLNATNSFAGTGVSNVLNVCNNTASAVTQVATFSNLSGVATDMVYINNLNTITSFIHINNNSGTATNLILVEDTNNLHAFMDLNGTTAENAHMYSESGTVCTTWKGRIRLIGPDGNPVWINTYSTSNEA